MKNFLQALVATFLASSLGLPTAAQTTNGVTTGAERQALYDAGTRADQQRRASEPAGSSTGSNSPSSGSGGYSRPQTLTEKEAEMNALFGFETAAQKAEARRAVESRWRAQQAAQAAAGRQRREQADLESEKYLAFQDKRAGGAVPWVKAQFSLNDALQLGLYSGVWAKDMKPETLMMMDRLKASRLAFLALYAQPGATYEALRALAQELPQQGTKADLSGGWVLGIETATEQYAQLLERFPAKPTAATDAIQAGLTYLISARHFNEASDFANDQIAGIQRLEDAVRAVRQRGQTLAPDRVVAVLRKRDETRRYLRSEYYMPDSAVTTRLARLGFEAVGQRLTQRPGPAGAEAQQLRAAGAYLAQAISTVLFRQQRLVSAYQWLAKSLMLDPASGAAVADQLVARYPTYPALLQEVPVAVWNQLAPSLQMAPPLLPEVLLSWLNDTVLAPDDPRWQTLTPAERAGLAQACAFGEYLATKQPAKYQDLLPKVATWNAVLAPGPGLQAQRAINFWSNKSNWAPYARNMYWANAKGYVGPAPMSHEAALAPVREFAERDASGQNQYQGALILLGELPGYPAVSPPTDQDRELAKAWLKVAAKNKYIPEARARLRQGL